MCNELGVAPPVQMPMSMNVEAREIEDGHLLTISSNSVYPGKTWYYPDMPTLLMNVTSRMLEEWGAAKRGPEVEPEETPEPDWPYVQTFGGEPTYDGPAAGQMHFKGDPAAEAVSKQQEGWTSGDQAKQPSTLDYRSKEQKAADQVLSKQQRVAWQAEIDSKVEVYRDRLERQYGLDDD